jgi:hypothetical protein
VQGKKRNLYIFMTISSNDFDFFQLHHCRVVCTMGDVSTPRINEKPATPSPYCHQHYQEGGKRRGKKSRPPHILPHFSHKRNLTFSISSLQGGPHNWGYLHPQNEWEAGNTIALFPTTLPRRQNKGKVRNHAIHIFFPIFSLTNFYFSNFIIAVRSAQLGISPPPE